MLRLWSDQLLVALRPDNITILRIHGSRSNFQEKIVRHCIPRESQPKWQAAIDALDDTLANKAYQGAVVSIVLSHHFVRAALVPGNVAVRDAREADAFAQHCIAQANGGLSGNWRVSMSDGLPGTTKIACAVEEQLFQAITNVIARSNNKLRSIRPYFVAAFDARRKYLSKHHAWFAVVEADRCCFGRIDRGHWKSLSARRIFSSVEMELPVFIQQEELLTTHGCSPEQVFIVAPNHGPIQPDASPPLLLSLLTLPLLKGMSLVESNQFSMALEAWH